MIGSGWVRLGLVGCWTPPALLVAGCTILAPVQTPEDDRRFPLKFPTTETLPCVDGSGLSKQCTTELKDSIDTFHGGLGRAMWEMDLRRRQLVAQAAERTNIQATYNALLWPLGAFLIAKKIHDPGWNTLDTAAFGVATYGLLGSGIPDRDKLYLKTAARMACTMVEFDADLYPSKEVQPTDNGGLDWRHGWPISGHRGSTLTERLSHLEWHIQQFSTKRDFLLTSLVLKTPKAGLSGRNSVEQARLSALGLTGSTKTPLDPSEAFRFETDRLISEAQTSLSEGERLKQQLDDAGMRMRKQRSVIEGALTQGLNDRTPELVSPAARGREITQAMEENIAASTAAAERLKKQSGVGRAEGWFPTPAQLVGVTPQSAQDLKDFWNRERTNLKGAAGRLDRWKTRHDERVRTAKADAAAMGCNNGTLGDFALMLRKVSEAATVAGATAAVAATRASEAGK